MATDVSTSEFALEHNLLPSFVQGNTIYTKAASGNSYRYGLGMRQILTPYNIFIESIFVTILSHKNTVDTEVERMLSYVM